MSTSFQSRHFPITFEPLAFLANSEQNLGFRRTIWKSCIHALKASGAEIGLGSFGPEAWVSMLKLHDKAW